MRDATSQTNSPASPTGALTATPSPSLLPPAQQNAWPKPAASAFLGIDIGQGEARVATLEPIDTHAGVLRWSGMQRFDLPLPANDSFPQLTEDHVRAVQQTLSERLPRSIEGERVLAAFSLPASWSHYQTVSGHELAATRVHCDQRFGQSGFRSNAQLSHWPVLGVHHGQPCSDDQYMTCAAPKHQVCQIADQVASLGYHVQTVLPRSVALVHAAQTLTGVDPQSVLWIGPRDAMIAIKHRTGIGLVRKLPAVPQRILDKHSPDCPLDEYTLRPYLSRIAEECLSTAHYASRIDQEHFTTKPILLAGPLAEIPGVDEAIANHAQTPIALWTILGRNRPAAVSSLHDEPVETIRRYDARYATALSLALIASRTSPRGYAK